MAAQHRPDIEPEFSRLIEVYGRALRRLCGAYMRDPADSQDLFQEIAMALWTALPRFRGAASERTWLYRVAHNVAITYSSRQRRRQGTEQPLDPTMSHLSTHDDPRRLALLQSIRQLEPFDRHLVLLYLEGFGAREIEEITGLAANNVAVRLTRLRRKLAAAIEPKEVPK